MLKKFSKEKRGNVVQYILVLAVIVVILQFSFPIIKDSMKKSTNDTACHLNNVTGNGTPDSCSVSGGGTPTPGDGMTPGDIPGGGAPEVTYDSCYEILQKKPSSKNGDYEIKLSNGASKTVTCDMTGGGWTLVSNYDFSKNRTAPAGSNLVAKDAFTSSIYAGTAPAGWYPMFANLSVGTMQAASFQSNQEGIPYNNVKIDMQFTFMWTADGFANTHGNPPNRLSIEGQYVDGVSVTNGDAGSRNHILTVSNGALPAGDSRVNFTGSNRIVGTTVNQTFTTAVNNSNKVIETRIMLDQTWQDENIGMQKYIVWVK